MMKPQERLFAVKQQLKFLIGELTIRKKHGNVSASPVRIPVSSNKERFFR